MTLTNTVTDTIDGDTAASIAIDVCLKVSPEKSHRVAYGPTELAARASIQRDWDEAQKKYPHAIMDIPD